MIYQINKIAGIDCIFAQMQNSNSTTIQIMAKAGSNYETEKESGIAHVIEHNFFKGGERYKTPSEVAIGIDKFGGAFNARTSTSEVGYYVVSAPNYTGQALDILADMIMNAKFSTLELEREKGVIIQEMKMYEDDPRSLVSEKRQRWRYGDNPYGRPTIGTVDNILSFTREDLIAYKNALYTKDNLIIVITGSFDEEKIKKLIETHFSTLPMTKGRTRESFPDLLPSKNQSFYDKKTEQNHLIISAKGIAGKDDRHYTSNILTTILGGNMSSRLFQNIREKQGLCYYIGAKHMAEPDFGDFFIRAGIDKNKFDFGLEKIYTEIANIASGNFTEIEFQNAITYTLGKLQMGIETSYSMANFLGEQYLHYGEIQTLEEIIQIYRNIKFEQVQEIAKMLAYENLYQYHIQ